MSILQLALDALTCAGSHDECQSLERCAIEALRAALEAPSTAVVPMPAITPYDHPDFVGGLVWTDMEIRAIQKYAQGYADACAQQARREALEAAACVCDVTALESLPDDFALDAVEHCAAAIRALGGAGK